QAAAVGPEMLVRIEPKDVEIGMFVHAFEGSWFDHPFWRRNFRVETTEQLRRIRNSGVAALTIDADRGLAPPAHRDAARNDGAPRNPSRPRGAPLAGAWKPRSRATLAAFDPGGRAAPRSRRGYAGECRRAKQAIDRTRVAVTDMFEAARLGRAVEVRRMVRLASAIGASSERDAKTLINLVRLKEKDEYTYFHSVAVCALMINFARHLELDAQEVEDMGVAGLLHDV